MLINVVITVCETEKSAACLCEYDLQDMIFVTWHIAKLQQNQKKMLHAY